MNQINKTAKISQTKPKKYKKYTSIRQLPPTLKLPSDLAKKTLIAIKKQDQKKSLKICLSNREIVQQFDYQLIKAPINYQCRWNSNKKA